MKNRLNLGATSLLLALTALIHSHAQAGSISLTPPQGVSEQCLAFLPKLEKLGWRGAWAEVPLDWKNPNSTEKAHVFFYFENKSAGRARTPILFLNGGPLVSFHGVTETLAAQARKYDLRDQHLFVMVDQRGVGCSTPAVPTELSQNSFKRVALFRSESIARDLEQIRVDFFAGQRWKVYAYSFGGTLAARYLTLFPQSASSYHVYAPAIFNNLPEFFAYRIIKQNEVLENFLAASRNPFIRNALALVNNKLCLPADAFAPKVCGRALLDGVLAGLGQGPGKTLNSRDNWESAEHALNSLLEKNEKNFVEKFAAPALGFFRTPTIAPVFAMWEADLDTLGGDLRESCSRAYSQVRRAGLVIDRLEVDECRMVIGNLTERTLRALKSGFVPGEQHLNAEAVARALQKTTGVEFFLYTGENDSSVNSLALKALARSPKVFYQHFPSHGHSAWRFEPKIWETLMRE